MPGTIPQQRVIEKMNAYMSRRDYAGAERHLLYWLAEARYLSDLRGELLVRNEMIGHYRKTGNREKAFESICEAASLLERLDFEGTISSGTTYTNSATALSAFGENEKALAYFEKARAVYESVPSTEPQLLGGLYNNMALACAALGRFDEARDLYNKALQKMKTVPNGALEEAITYLNLADLIEAEKGGIVGEREIGDLLDKALACLHLPEIPHDGYYAFVCEKCAPVFTHYGYFMDAEELSETAERIYRGTSIDTERSPEK